jgi:hypothetical protein
MRPKIERDIPEPSRVTKNVSSGNERHRRHHHHHHANE